MITISSSRNIQKVVSLPKVNILGVNVSAINIPLALTTIEEWIACDQKQYVCVTGVHGVMESQQDLELLKIHNRAGMVTPDGMPLVWIMRSKGYHYVDRVYGPDLMLAACRFFIKKDYKHFLYGGATGVPELLMERLLEKIPGLRVVGTYSPPFRNLTVEEDELIIKQINDSYPDIIWVGLSTPKQEHWMAEHRDKLTAPVLIGVGAAFDFHAGIKRQAPRWMQQAGLEWFFRLITEPKRLWRRYLANNPRFIMLLLAQWLKIKSYSSKY